MFETLTGLPVDRIPRSTSHHGAAFSVKDCNGYRLMMMGGCTRVYVHCATESHHEVLNMNFPYSGTETDVKVSREYTPREQRRLLEGGWYHFV